MNVIIHEQFFCRKRYKNFPKYYHYLSDAAVGFI